MEEASLFLVLLTVVSIIAGIIVFGIFSVYRAKKSIEDNRWISLQTPWFVTFEDIQIIGVKESKKQKSYEKRPARKKVRADLIGVISQNSFLISKYMKKNKIVYSKNEIHMLYIMKTTMNHDNLNLFGGFAESPTKLYVIWSLCERGSLHDFIFTQEQRREVVESFEGFVIRDILKGLEYLHESELGFHGNLTLHNCMLDSYWIVKLSDFGMNEFYLKWKTKDDIYTVDHTPIIRTRDLHYFDPEIKTMWKTFIDNPTAAKPITNEFRRTSDLYSFGVVLYEISFKKKMVEPLHECPLVVENSLFIDGENDFIASKDPLTIEMPENVDIHRDLTLLMRQCFKKQIKGISQIRKIMESVFKIFKGSIVDLMLTNLANYTQQLNDTVAERTRQLAGEQLKADQLLMELIPSSIADDLKKGNIIRTQKYDSVTILYSDIVGFTALSSESTPDEIVAFLNGMYQRFDLIISQQGGYKMETIGDAYCVAAGLPVRSTDEHVKIISTIALLQRDILNEFEIPHRPGKHLNCRWGFDTGEVFTGVIGLRAPRYACFGETVFLASKMENSGEPDKIQMSLASHDLLESCFPHFVSRARGGVTIAGRGRLLTYWLTGVKEIDSDKLQEFRDEIYRYLNQFATREKNNMINFRRSY